MSNVGSDVDIFFVIVGNIDGDFFLVEDCFTQLAKETGTDFGFVEDLFPIIIIIIIININIFITIRRRRNDVSKN